MRFAAASAILVLFWAVGLLAFAARVDRSTPAVEPRVSDGVVALTGGSDARITEAMRLLEEGKAGRMLISGVNPHASRADIRGVARASHRLYDCCVDLGFEATDTVGNARETARWARAKGFRTMIVVTSDFHMPRAMVELRGAMPEARFRAYPVKTGELDARRWWKGADGVRRMVLEYDKYLVSLVRDALGKVGGRGEYAYSEPVADNGTARP